MVWMKLLVVNVEKDEGRDLEDGKDSNDDNLIDTDKCELPIPPEVHEETVLQSDEGVVDGVLHPTGSLLDVDDIEDEDGRHDKVEDKLRHGAPHTVDGAAEV